MARSRVLFVTLLTGVCLYGVPLPVDARPRFPDTVDKTVELARGLRIAATPRDGVFVERPAKTLPIRGNLIAMSFRANDAEAAEEGIEIQAKFRRDDGWSPWEELHLEPDEAPDDASAESRRASDRVFTAPIWVGTADRMAFRVVAHAGAPVMEDLRAHVINTLGDLRKPTIFSRVGAVVARFVRGSTPPAAEAATSTPAIIKRAQWGASESWRECCPRYAPALHMAFVHHTVTTNSYSRSESAAIVRGVYRFHTSNRGWSDIGYNFLVDKYGQIFEGRYGGLTSTVIGAHVKGFNTGSTGMSMMGDYTRARPTSAMLTSLKRLLAWKLDVHHVPPVGRVVMTSAGNPKYAAGTRVSFNRIAAHRDGQQTACPGAYIVSQLPSVRTAVNAMGRPKIYLPTITSKVLRPLGDPARDRVVIKATFSQTVSWVIEWRTTSGTLLQRIAATAGHMAATWNGKTLTGQLGPTGLVRYTITARAGSASARPALGSLYLLTKHPNGTVLTTPTQTVLIEGGAARRIPSTLVKNSWFRSTEPVATTDDEIGRYAVGTPITLREGTLLAESDGSYSIFSGGLRRDFASGAFEALGYSPAAALPVSAAELAALPSGPNVVDVTRHPAGAIVRAADGSEWTIGATTRMRNRTSTVRRSWYRDAEVATALPGDLGLPEGTPQSYRQGTLLRLGDGSYWIVSDGTKRKFDSPFVYTSFGYSTAAAFSITTTEASSIPTGTPIIT